MKTTIKYYLCISFMIVCLCFKVQAQKSSVYEIASPDKSLVIVVENDSVLRYSLKKNNNIVINPSTIRLMMNGGPVWGEKGIVIGQTIGTTNEKVYPVAGNDRELTNHYNQLSLKFKKGYSVVFRLYNEGMAYRFCGNRPAQDSLVVVNEDASFNLSDNPAVILPQTDNFTAWELSNVLYNGVSDIKENKYGITPTLFTNQKQNLRIVIAESDLNNYPGMYIRKKNGMMRGFWAAYPKKIEMGSWGNFITVVKERQNYLARTAGNHAFPWRVAIVAQNDKDLLANNMIYLLAKPQQISNTDWIHPGKATWEWWHCAILEKAPFKSGSKNLSTQLYKYYIDFAAENKIDYLLVDAGWSNVFNPTDLNKNIDIKEVIRYGKEKKVGVWLWTVAATLFQNPNCYLDSISSWGAAGVKIDFFDRDDAQVMPEYENLAKACAERHLMVDFHGCSKPTGLNRAYPNILSYEAMRGEECFKWDTSSNPDYQLQCVFSRMLVGGIDYTPGSMRNCTLEKFKPIDPGLPSSLGTRAHELAMYVVLTSPFACLSDSPDEYRKYPDILNYLGRVPTSWDKSVPLAARVGEYAVIAKQKGDVWYVGGLNAWGERKITFNCSFLEPGKKYTVELFKDKKASNKEAQIYEHKVIKITGDKTFQMDMASGGGFVMVINEL
ncbi:glycoside hydrolase family 97 protein [uncultured Bacteroides sp.]|uniref:glycoside hydrolase family 97 protein n=1 Tax=uncultured Bacteroides sp. TaxID=162156 RepID=UPI002AA5EF48|nr:glycoside hydrolase family 97 protein [uncultured Bacteroides sp.]